MDMIQCDNVFLSQFAHNDPGFIFIVKLEVRGTRRHLLDKEYTN